MYPVGVSSHLAGRFFAWSRQALGGAFNVVPGGVPVPLFSSSLQSPPKFFAFFRDFAFFGVRNAGILVVAKWKGV